MVVRLIDLGFAALEVTITHSCSSFVLSFLSSAGAARQLQRRIAFLSCCCCSTANFSSVQPAPARLLALLTAALTTNQMLSYLSKTDVGMLRDDGVGGARQATENKGKLVLRVDTRSTVNLQLTVAL